MRFTRFIFIIFFVCESYAQKSDFESINFKSADSIALAYKNAALKNLPKLVYNLTSHFDTDAEKFRAIYMWVSGNISNDYHLFLKTKRKKYRYRKDSLKLERWNKELKAEVFQKLIEENRTICTGYAYLLKELAHLADIECEIIHGYGRTSTTNIEKLIVPNHSWNAVKLNGKWYLCDATWASGIPDPETFNFKFQYNDGFFLANPELFAINHFPVDTEWLLLEERKITFSNFLEGPVIYGNAFNKLENHIEPKKLENTVLKDEKIIFKYQLLNEIETDKINFVIDNGNRSHKIVPDIIDVVDNTITIEYNFKHRGTYDLHFYIDKDIISSYTFKVRKISSEN